LTQDYYVNATKVKMQKLFLATPLTVSLHFCVIISILQNCLPWMINMAWPD